MDDEHDTKPTAYIETSVVSYLTARPSRDVVVAAYQQVTREWWDRAADRFNLVASELVVAEAGAGDTDAARTRLKALEAITLLDATEDAAELAGKLVALGSLPQRAAEDAAHIAIAVTNGIDYLVTWNFRHIANAAVRSRNAAVRSRIERICRQEGYEPVVICTPNELMEPDDAIEAD